MALMCRAACSCPATWRLWSCRPLFRFSYRIVSTPQFECVPVRRGRDGTLAPKRIVQGSSANWIPMVTRCCVTTPRLAVWREGTADHIPSGGLSRDGRLRSVVSPYGQQSAGCCGKFRSSGHGCCLPPVPSYHSNSVVSAARYRRDVARPGSPAQRAAPPGIPRGIAR